MPFEGTTGEKMRKALFVTIILLACFLAVQTLLGFRGLSYVGAGLAPSNVLNVSGHGEILAVPDIAQFSFSVQSTKATVTEAQAEVTAKSNAITEYIKGQKVDTKDIQTTDYSLNPQYEYQEVTCPAVLKTDAPVYCPPGKQVLRGYQVNQTTTIKIHDTAKAGDLLAGVGSRGATNVSGISFTFDDPTKVQQQARDKAIEDAKQKGDMLAKSLGVSLVRVVSFNENNTGYNPHAVAFGRAVNQAMDSKAPAAPEVSVGQNMVSVDVSITYEIR